MKKTLPVIVLSQFFCTSLWFAGNAILPDLGKILGLSPDFVAHLTSMVQLGFVAGTLVFAILTIADRYSPSRVFFFCSLIAGLFNLGVSWPGANEITLLILRFFTGFLLAGIYPVGMKIAADYFDKGLGKSLGYLVGALVVGTGFPHLLKSLTAQFSWQYVVYGTTLLSWTGGLMMWILIPDGPYRKASQQFNPRALLEGFRIRELRTVALGYFGHMWELYAFWAFVPVVLANYKIRYPTTDLNIPLLSFVIIASGGLACVLGGYISIHYGTKKTAMTALFLSGVCCLLSPLFLLIPAPAALISFLVFWGLVVIADSPLFSTLIAQSAPATSRGSALTIVNCIGFSITIVSIQVIQLLSHMVSPQYIYLILGCGPLLGLFGLSKIRLG